MKDSPYIGPVPFGRSDAQFFAGRDIEATELCALIKAHCLTILYAPSGAGKTSLLNALVIPRLEEEYCDVAPIARVAGSQTAETLSQPALRANALPLADRNPFAENLLASLDGNPSAWDMDAIETIAYLLSAEPAKHDDNMPRLHVVIIDQFEELFTRYPEAWSQRRVLLQTIADAIEAQPALSVVLSMREEYVPALEPLLADLVFRTQRRFRLPLLGTEQAAAAIREPAAKRNVNFLQDAVDLQVERLRGKYAVPGREPTLSEFVEPLTLQIVCRRIWAALPDDATEIDRGIVDDVGQVETALEAYYNECISAASNALMVPEWKLRAFVQSNLIDARNQRRLFNPSSLGGVAGQEAARLVTDLEERRILRPEVRQDETSYELAHDQFVPAILRSNSAHKEPLVALLIAARQWHSMGMPEDQLLSAEQLESARQWVAQNDPNGLTGTQLSRYIEQSERVANAKLRQRKVELEAKQKQLEEKQQELTTANTQLKRSKSNTNILAICLAVLLGLSVMLAWNALEQSREVSETSARVNEEVGLLLASNAHPPELLSTALALSSMQAYRKHGKSSPRAEEVIRAVLGKFPPGRAYWKEKTRLTDIPPVSADGMWSYVQTTEGDYLVDLKTFTEKEIERIDGGFPEFVGGDAYVLVRPAGYSTNSPRLLVTASGADHSSVFAEFGRLIDCCDFAADGSVVLIQGEMKTSLVALGDQGKDIEFRPIDADERTSLLLSADGNIMLKISEKSRGEWVADAHLSKTDSTFGHLTSSASQISKRDFRLSKNGRLIAQLSRASTQGKDSSSRGFQTARSFYNNAGLSNDDATELWIWSSSHPSHEGNVTWARTRVDTSNIAPIVTAEFLDDRTLLVITRVDGYRSSRVKIHTVRDSGVDTELETVRGEQSFHDYRFVPHDHPVALHLYGQTRNGPNLLLVTAEAEKYLDLRPLPDYSTPLQVLLSAHGDTAVHLTPSGGVASYYNPSHQVESKTTADLSRLGCKIIEMYRSQQPESSLVKATDVVCATPEGTT